ncbi:MAG TPA: NADH-quinone oxidoreductase subunit J [Firmicutes bacterium]|nr:MAG: NADH-quinone oxidoreductase subunit J [Candidatus Coatesbacteria bacterium]RLC43805.1 MAG: NADH-quinone oxidoreductase subunit J [Candidatus Coatesbacteria bacterium]RLC44994.1 MAG: NADH-quinone oxidoreductase subunit J [Candidatus Coatesbacteria bacterium]HDM43040.1 NADH-quinone oxidoreductase subunit J [Bacillota bacterium]
MTGLETEEILSAIVFYLLSGVVVGSSILVITLRNIFRSALFLLLAFFATAGLFITLDAEFIAAVQVLIYVGAIGVLILFAIMLTRRIQDPVAKSTTRSFILGAFVSAAFLFFLILILGKIYLPPFPETGADTEGITKGIGRMLLTYYLLPFEVVSVLLVGALIGAVVIARKEEARGGEPPEVALERERKDREITDSKPDGNGLEQNDRKH